MLNRHLLFVILALQLGCKNNNSDGSNIVEFYLMKSYLLVPGKCLVDNRTVILQDTPFIKNDEVLKYSFSTHEYLVSKGCQEKFCSLTPRTPLAVTVNKEVIYTAIKMASYISSSCDNSIVLMFNDSSKKIEVNLGYPGITVNSGIDDQRNNAALVSALSDQGKLQ